MRVLEVIGIAVLIVLAGLLMIFARREVISRHGGTIDMNMRLSTFAPERGWAPGLGRFVGDELHWYRLFSLAIRPRRTLSRNDLTLLSRRRPQGAERLAMPEGWVVLSNVQAGNRDRDCRVRPHRLPVLARGRTAGPHGPLGPPS